MVCAAGEKKWRVTRCEKGFTLIEVLVAVAILATGLLAIAAMQDVAMSRTVDSKRMTIATNLVAEMMERIRFNSPANATLVSGVYPYSQIRACNYACPGGSTQGNATAANNLTANGDYNQWLGHLSALDTAGQPILPSAMGTVTSTSVGTSVLGQVQVTVQVQYSSGLRTPTITMTTLVAPQ